MTRNELPERWREAWRPMELLPLGNKPDHMLQDWLEELCFDKKKNADLTRDNMFKVGELVRRMLRFEPSERASAKGIIHDAWFKGN